MVLLDTSAWIFALRPSGSREIQARVRPLILNGEAAFTDWIMLELMTGLRKGQRAASLLEFFHPSLDCPFMSHGGQKPGGWRLRSGRRDLF